MSAKHTPGPWYNNSHGADIDTYDEGFNFNNWQISLKTPRENGIGVDELEANARLIAAAPELFEALNIAIVDSEMKLTLKERKQRAGFYKAAIAKAK